MEENTKQQLLKEIQLAIELIEETRANSRLTKYDKKNIEIGLLKLSNIEQAVIRSIGDDLVSKLTDDVKELERLVVEIDKASDLLVCVAKQIGKVANLVNALNKALLAAVKLM